MTTQPPPAIVDGLRLRKIMGKDLWSVPQRYGITGWSSVRAGRTGSLIVSEGDFHGTTWIHVSLSRVDQLPTYEEITRLHRAVFGDGYAYQVFAPTADHVNIHPNALHLYGRADGKPALPNFAPFGTI